MRVNYRSRRRGAGSRQSRAEAEFSPAQRPSPPWSPLPPALPPSGRGGTPNARFFKLPFVHFVPLDNRIALRSNHLPGEIHEDPADRIIIATALTLGAPLVSKDTRIRDYPHVETIW
ncbi:MAG TPA: PIN domain-containing protein [Thermoanaerobaculia bacterium]|nr:PIN domain-containing protein [Thermoanaerobaculia bacterium]